VKSAISTLSFSELEAITGQKPIVTKSKKSVANFKIREGMPIGTKVTLRGDKMYYFVDKLFNISLPRVRDFKGVNKNSFDGRGNQTNFRQGTEFLGGSQRERNCGTPIPD